MATTDFLFIQPLLGADDAWSGYRATFASAAGDSALLGRLTEAAQIDDFDHRHPWLLPAAAAAGQSGRLGERAVFIFPPHPPTADADTLTALEATLRQQHAKVGLIASPDSPLPATGSWPFVVLTAGHARALPPFTLFGLASRTSIVATDVLSHADRQWLLANACTLCSAEFLLARAPASGKADTTRIKLLALLALIAEDADTAALDAVFRQETKLSYSLLRLVNSAAIAPTRPITSFSQAINLLGRRQLQRWLQLLVYADPNHGHQPNPLLQKAAARGHLMESLARRLNPRPAIDNLEDAAFMIGSFSLLHVLLNMSMNEIVQQLPLTHEVSSALIDHAGLLGELLHAVTSAEAGDLQGATMALKKLCIGTDAHLDAQLAALSWAAKIHVTGD